MTRPDDRTRSTARVGFSIIGDDVEPEAFTALVGITPTRAWRKGDNFRSRTTPDRLRYHPYGVWRVECAAEHLELAARALLAVVEGKVEHVKGEAERRGLRVVVTFWWEPEGGQGGFDVDAVTMRRLCALCHEMTFYFA